MPITQEDLEAAHKAYVDALPKAKELREKLKEQTKILGRQKNIFKKYMKENSLTSLRVGNMNFAMQEEESVPLKMDLVENHFPSNLVEEYKQKNKKRKVNFKET